MSPATPDLELLLKELKFRFSRSSGKGGQNVNKVETKAELYFDVQQSRVLNEEQKEWLVSKLSNRISSEGLLQITSQTGRTQLQNKEEGIKKFSLLILKCFTPKRKRVKTRPSKQAKEKRLKEKKRISEIKLSRQKPYEH